MDTLIERYDSSTTRKPKSDKRPVWIFLGLIAFIVKMATMEHPQLVEEVYSTKVFTFIRSFFDYTTGWLGFPASYLVIPLLLFKIWGVYLNGMARSRGCAGIIFSNIFSTVASLGWLFFWFTLLWGLNYNRESISDKLSLSTPTIQQSEVFEDIKQRAEELHTLRKSLDLTNGTVQEEDISESLVATLQEEVRETMKQFQYKSNGKVPVRQLPKGWLLRFSTAGVYFPYTGEANIDAGLHPLQKPFTIAHELAHGYGEGDEATCNFIAYIACKNSSHPMIQYSGKLMYWRYLASGYRVFAPEEYQAFRNQLPSEIRADLDAINTNNQKYPDIFPELRDAVYDAFLKFQGVASGIQSYGQVVKLVYAYEKR